MCRLIGFISDKPQTLSQTTGLAPLERLATWNPHGWGIAATTPAGGWSVAKAPTSAASDGRFPAEVRTRSGQIVIAHLRLASMGAVKMENTHPFRSGRWTFAHNGTIHGVERLSALAPGPHGTTDSEAWFHHLLGRLRGVRCDQDVDYHVFRAVADTERFCRVSGLNFLLSNGRTLWAHRLGYGLCMLDTRTADAKDGAVIFASEPLSAEPWREIGQNTLVRVNPGPDGRMLITRYSTATKPPVHRPTQASWRSSWARKPLGQSRFEWDGAEGGE
jgi:glutamine amidotransferase